MLKKFMVLLLTLSCILSGTVSVFAEETINAEREINILTALGIFDPQAKATITTRSGAITYLLRLMDANLPSGTDKTSVFEDVSANISNINTAYRLGIIKGAGGLFRPDDPITAQELIVMLDRILGYSETAEYYGGYPAGYTRVANDLKLLNHAEIADMNTALSYEQLAEIFYNALDAEVMIQDGNGKFVKGDRNLLNYYHDIYDDKGIVTANYRTNLGNAGDVDSSFVRIQDRAFAVGNTDAAQHIGEYVSYYYRADDKNGTDELLYIETDDKTSVLTIDCEDVSEQTQIDKIIYTTDANREKTLTLPKDLTVVYNNKLCNNLTRADFKPESGSLRLVDNDGDGKYNILFINSYKTVIVKKVFSDGDKIQDYIEGDTIELSKYGILALTDASGNAMEASDITKWNVLSIAESKDGDIAEVIVSNDKAVGRVEKMSDESVTIAEKEYKLSDYFKNRQNNPLLTLQAGKMISAYIDFRGRVAGCDNTLVYGRTGLLVSAYEETEFSDEYGMKLIDREQEALKLKLAKNVSIDGKGYTGQALGEKLQQIRSNTWYGVVPVLYELNDKGEVTKLETPSGTRITTLSNDENYYYSAESHTFLKEKRNGIFCSGSATFFCYIPENYTSLNDYTVCTLQDMNDIDQKTSIFSIDNSRIADFVLIPSSAGQEATVGDSEPLAVVADKYKSVDADGSIIDMITVYKSGKKVEVPSKTEDGFADLEKGDIIFYSPDVKGVVDKIAEVYKAGETKIYSNAVNAKGRLAGKVQYKEGDIIGVAADPTTEDLIYNNLFTKAPVYVYDTATNQVSVGTIDDIIDADSSPNEASMVFIQTRYTLVKNIVVYK